MTWKIVDCLDIFSKLWNTGGQWFWLFATETYKLRSLHLRPFFWIIIFKYGNTIVNQPWTSKIIITIAIQRFWIIGRSGCRHNQGTQVFRKLLVLEAVSRHISILIAMLILTVLRHFCRKRCPFPCFNPWVCRPPTARHIPFSTQEAARVVPISGH